MVKIIHIYHLFLLDQKKMLSEIEKHDPSCIFLAYPNNPTGNLFDHTLIKKIIDRASGLVIIDEAYHPYSGQTFLTEILENEHMVVLRTFSKFGLAGLRLGFLVGPHPWLEEINKVRLPYNINSVTQASVRFALSKEAWFRKHESGHEESGRHFPVQPANGRCHDGS